MWETVILKRFIVHTKLVGIIKNPVIIQNDAIVLSQIERYKELLRNGYRIIGKKLVDRINDVKSIKIEKKSKTKKTDKNTKKS